MKLLPTVRGNLIKVVKLIREGRELVNIFPFWLSLLFKGEFDQSFTVNLVENSKFYASINSRITKQAKEIAFSSSCRNFSPWSRFTLKNFPITD